MSGALSRTWKVLVSASDEKTIRNLIGLAQQSGGEFYRYHPDDIPSGNPNDGQSKLGPRSCFHIKAASDASAKRLYNTAKIIAPTAIFLPYSNSK